MPMFKRGCALLLVTLASVCTGCNSTSSSPTPTPTPTVTTFSLSGQVTDSTDRNRHLRRNRVHC